MPQEPAAAPPEAADREKHAVAGNGRLSSPAHLVIESLPARTDAFEVVTEIVSRAERRHWHGPHAELARGTALPVYDADDQSTGADVRILLTLLPGSDPAAVRDQLTTITGISTETACAFPAPLASLLRSWVDDYRGEDISGSLAELANAIQHDRPRRPRG